jgi:sulfonate transport system substrate-binding protein
VNVEKVVAARGNYEVSYITSDVIRQQQSIADTFAKLGLIPHAVPVADVVWTPGAKLSVAGVGRP